MRTIQVRQLDYDLTPTAGLALVGHFLKTLAPALADVDAALPVRTGVATSDIVRSYLGLLVQGKSDFDAIENLRGDKFFKQALGIGLLPSSPTLRQRMDANASSLAGHVMPMIERLLARHAPDYGVLPCGWLPLDIDTFAMDNSGTAKEGVGRTYAGVDGYCPLAAYLGSHGFCLDLVLRPGTQHPAKHTDDDLRRIVPMAQRLSAAGPKAPLLARLDSRFADPPSLATLTVAAGSPVLLRQTAIPARASRRSSVSRYATSVVRSSVAEPRSRAIRRRPRAPMLQIGQAAVRSWAGSSRR